MDNSDLATHYRKSGDKYLSDGKYELAIEAYSEAINLEPNNEEIYNARSAIYNALGDYEKALVDINKAIDINPGKVYFYTNRITYDIMLGHIDKAIVDFERVLKICPDQDHDETRHFISCSMQAWEFIQKARQCEKEGLLEEGIKFCTEADKCNPFLVEAKNVRGILYCKLQKFDEAILDHTNAKMVRPRHFDAYFALGNLYIAKNESDKAILEYNQVLALKPDHARAYFYRGVAYYTKKCYVEAWEDMKKVESLGLMPDQEFIKKLSVACPLD